MHELPLLTVDLRFHRDMLKVTWNDGGMDYEPYFVDAARLERLGRVARDRLAPLVHRARNADLAGVAPDLQALAEAGNDLYQALFITAVGTGAEAEIVRDDLERKREPFRLLLKVEQRIHVPWGLIYDAHPRTGTAIDEFVDFWCIKRFLSTVHHRVPPRPEPRDRQDFRVLPVLNRASFEAARDAIGTDERAIVDQLFGTSAHPVFSTAEFLQRWRNETRGMLGRAGARSTTGRSSRQTTGCFGSCGRA